MILFVEKFKMFLKVFSIFCVISSILSAKFDDSYNCLIHSTNETGVYKTKEHCHNSDLIEASSKTCDEEICDDLLCCSIKNNNHKKKTSIHKHHRLQTDFSLLVKMLE